MVTVRCARAGRGSCCATTPTACIGCCRRNRRLAARSTSTTACTPEDYETNILIADGVAWFKSEGSIRMAEGLGLPWRLAAVFRILPLAWRDRLYQTVARNRLRWFGKRATCYLPDPRFADRFIA